MEPLFYLKQMRTSHNWAITINNRSVLFLICIQRFFKKKKKKKKNLHCHRFIKIDHVTLTSKVFKSFSAQISTVILLRYLYSETRCKTCINILRSVSFSESTLNMVICGQNTAFLLLQTARCWFLVRLGDFCIQRLNRSIGIWMDEKCNGMTAPTTMFWHNDSVSQRW